MRLRSFAAVLVALAAAGCGPSSDSPTAPATAPSVTEAPAPAADPGAVVDAVTLEGTDQMQFSVKAFTVKAGSTVTLTLRNGGQLPKETFGHNVVLLRAGVDVKGYAEAAASAADHLAPGREADVIAHTKLLGPGETETITFTAPAEAGAYPYVCTFPGHFAAMQGVMTVVP